MIRLTASDFHTLFRPSKCENRVYLKQIGIEQAPPGPFDEVLFRLGKKHEESHLTTFPEYLDLSTGRPEEREERTEKVIQERFPVLYQARFKSHHAIGNTRCEIVGEPDFLIREGDSYVVRDSKISRRITERDHPQILRQLEIYGWLFEQTLGRPPGNLEVHSGTGDIVSLPYDGGATALQVLEEILSLKQATSEQYSPVGWTKCGGCSFNHHCWPRAEENRDVALVGGVDQNLAAELRREGVNTIEQLLERFDEDSLSEFRRPWGARMQRVGTRATAILRMAQSMSSGQEIIIAQPVIPEAPNYVMFDLEGLPPHLDEVDKIYLWGLQVFGEKPGQFISAVAGFGNEGDQEGWERFLDNAKGIFSQHGDIPFVHWHHYERVRIDMYVERYGDIDSIAARVKQNLLDLLPITNKSIAVPLPSYSLKVVEKYVGFQRTLDEASGDWAMAKYIEAVETEDKDQRNAVMNEILAYNREDLEATWAVLKWLKTKSSIT